MVEIFDNVGDTSGDLTGKTDFDAADKRNLTIHCTAPSAGATDWHVYIRSGLGGMKYLGHSGSAEPTLNWYPKAPNIAPEFAGGPDFNTAYTFRMARITSKLKPEDIFDQAGFVGFNIEGGNPVNLAQPAMPDLEPGTMVVCDDIFGIRNLAPPGKVGSDVDSADWRAVQIAWNFGVSGDDVSDYQIYVSVDNGAFEYLGHTSTGKMNYFWWTPNKLFDTTAKFITGPQGGHSYKFSVAMLPW
jgi:hypothetical protein